MDNKKVEIIKGSLNDKGLVKDSERLEIMAVASGQVNTEILSFIAMTSLEEALEIIDTIGYQQFVTVCSGNQVGSREFITPDYMRNPEYTFIISSEEDLDKIIATEHCQNYIDYLKECEEFELDAMEKKVAEIKDNLKYLSTLEQSEFELKTEEKTSYLDM